MSSALQSGPNKQAILAFPMLDIVARYTKEFPKANDSAVLHEQELKRYLFICAKYPFKGWPMVYVLDDLWHTFLIFTQDYHQFCQLSGRPYIHHQPLKDGEDTSGIPAAYQEFMTLYRQEFGEPTDSIWPGQLMMNDCGSGCSDGGCSGIGCGSTCGSSCR